MIRELVVAGSLIAGFVLLAGVSYFFLHRVVRRFRDRIAGRLIGVVTWPILVFLTLQGVFLATTILSDLDPWREQIGTAWVVTGVALVFLAGARVTSDFLAWYARFVASRTTTKLDEKLVPTLRRILLVGIYVLGALAILNVLGISITPLLAAAGIGGLAVALALQPLLGNFFAGTYVVSDGAISTGDYIELEGGVAGYVVEMGWRSTKIRTSFNNLVIIPNSRLADSILTNYQSPTSDVWAFIAGGVSYASDLTHVERVALEVAREVLRECSGAVTDSEPWFGFDTFGDSNIGFWFFLQSTDRFGSFLVKSDLVKRLHNRFGQEGIEINYPVRKLVFSATDGALPTIQYGGPGV